MAQKTKIFAALLIILAISLIAAGCTSQPSQKPVTVTPTQPLSTPPPFSDTPKVTPISGPGTPEPTEVLPSIYSLEFQVGGNGNSAVPKVYVILSGGKGMELDSAIDIRFTNSKGEVQEASMPKPFYSGEQVVFDNASANNFNRVEIWVTAPQVGRIKTYDSYVPFKTLS
jgi:hypothetical protein